MTLQISSLSLRNNLHTHPGAVKINVGWTNGAEWHAIGPLRNARWPGNGQEEKKQEARRVSQENKVHNVRQVSTLV